MDWNLRQVIEPIESLQLVSFEEQFVTPRGRGLLTQLQDMEQGAKTLSLDDGGSSKHMLKAP